jgi:hypothetical protein
MGSALSTFTDFVASTGPSYLTSADQLVNEAVKNSYIMRRFLKGADKSFVIQGGSSIKDALILDEDSTFQQYQPNDTFTWRNPQVMSTATANWRFSVDHMSWTDQEIELNVGTGMTTEALRGIYKRLKREKEQRMWTSMINGWEDLLWRLPKNSEMESDSGLYPYSIPAFINERTNGLYDFSGDSFTTVEGISPTTKTRWKPQTEGLAAASAADTAWVSGNSPLINAFDAMFYKIKFETPPTKAEYFEDPKLYAQFIACSRKAINLYQRALRNAQDQFRGAASPSDPSYLNPMYGGIELMYVAALDTAALYTTSNTAFVSETSDSTNNTGPRYYWINGQYLTPVFHTSRYMAKKDPMVHPNQPFTTVVPVDCWWNLFCRSRQRHGIVYPAGDITSY